LVVGKYNPFPTLLAVPVDAVSKLEEASKNGFSPVILLATIPLLAT
jgi:hypothetical protein